MDDTTIGDQGVQSLGLFPQDHDANAVPCLPLHAGRWGVLHRDDSDIARVELEVALEIFADQDGANTREPELVYRPGAITIALNHNGALENGVAVFRKRAIQARLAAGGEFFLAVRTCLEEFRGRIARRGSLPGW